MKLDELTDKQRKLFSSHIEYAADRLSNDTCDDCMCGSFDGWTEEEKKELCKIYNKWNNVDEDDRQAILKCSHCGTILARRDRHSEKFYQEGSSRGSLH